MKLHFGDKKTTTTTMADLVNAIRQFVMTNAKLLNADKKMLCRMSELGTIEGEIPYANTNWLITISIIWWIFRKGGCKVRVVENKDGAIVWKVSNISQSDIEYLLGVLWDYPTPNITISNHGA